MYRALVNVTKEEIDESSKKTVDSIINGDYASDMSDYYANEMLKAKSNNACRLGHKGPFLFIEDVSSKYSSVLENKVYYRCFCLECGKLDDYQMSRRDRKLLVKIDDIDYSIYGIDNIRKRYFELLNDGLNEEETVAMLNEVYNDKNKKLEKVKK